MVMGWTEWFAVAGRGVYIRRIERRPPPAAATTQRRIPWHSRLQARLDTKTTNKPDQTISRSGHPWRITQGIVLPPGPGTDGALVFLSDPGTAPAARGSWRSWRQQLRTECGGQDVSLEPNDDGMFAKRWCEWNLDKRGMSTDCRGGSFARGKTSQERPYEQRRVHPDVSTPAQ